MRNKVHIVKKKCKPNNKKKRVYVNDVISNRSFEENNSNRLKDSFNTSIDNVIKDEEIDIHKEIIKDTVKIDNKITKEDIEEKQINNSEKVKLINFVCYLTIISFKLVYS